MTMPNERTRAVLETPRFLERLAFGRMRHESPEQLQEYAEALLRHYPSAGDMHLAAMALPMFWATPERGRSP